MAKKQSKMLSIKLIRSLAGTKQSHKETAQALVLTRINKTVSKEDTEHIRGMLHTIDYLIQVTE